MDSIFNNRDCEGCPSRLVCRCLQVTEETVLTALEAGGISTLRDLRKCTGAGDGCTACHRRLKGYLERRVSLAMA